MAQERKRRPDLTGQRQVDTAREQSAPYVGEGAIRQRAYDRYRERGYENGRDLDDWLEAERELLGSPANE